MQQLDNQSDPSWKPCLWKLTLVFDLSFENLLLQICHGSDSAYMAWVSVKLVDIFFVLFKCYFRWITWLCKKLNDHFIYFHLFNVKAFRQCTFVEKKEMTRDTANVSKFRLLKWKGIILLIKLSTNPLNWPSLFVPAYHVTRDIPHCLKVCWQWFLIL